MKDLTSPRLFALLTGLSIAFFAVPAAAASAATVPDQQVVTDTRVPARPGEHVVPVRVQTGGGRSHGSEGGETECCTDPDPDPGGDNAPDVDVDGPGGDTDPGGGGEEPPGGGGGDEPPTGGGGDDPDPGDDDLFEIWDCWENGNCDDTGGGRDTDDTGGGRDTDDTGGDTGDTGSLPSGPLDSGPTL